MDNFRAFLSRADDGRVKRVLPPPDNINGALFGIVRQIFNPCGFVFPEMLE